MRFLPWTLAGLALVLANAALAGSNTATLSCQRPGTAFKLEGVIPASESGFDLTFTDAAGKLRMSWGEKYNVSVVENFKAGVFTLQIEGERGLTLYALPKTVRARGGAGFMNATFQAVLERAPKTSKAGDEYPMADTYHDEMRMRCRYDYSI